MSLCQHKNHKVFPSLDPTPYIGLRLDRSPASAPYIYTWLSTGADAATGWADPGATTTTDCGSFDDTAANKLANGDCAQSKELVCQICTLP